MTGDTEFKDEHTEVEITKTDLTSQAPVPGATVVIYDQSGTEVFRDVTDENGKIKVTYLPHGKYSFKEVIAPDNYRINENTFSFEINSEGLIADDSILTFTDAPTEVVITKTDLTDEAPVPGAVIVIYDSEGNEAFRDTTKEDGTIKAVYLPHGKYTFKEITAPDNYRINEDTFSFEINDKGVITDDSVLTFSDAPTEVVITKTDLTSAAPVPGATVIICDSAGNEVFRDITGEDGTIRKTHLLHGKYTFKEIIAPSRYQINENSFSFEIDERGAVTDDSAVSFTDAPTEIVIKKLGSDNQTGLSGCFIRIFNADNECVYDSGKDGCAPTDENGVIRITGLPHGDYSYIETQAPEGYSVSKNVYTFSIDALGHVTDTSDTVIVDNPTEVTLTKTDIVDSQPVPGAVIEIYDKDGQMVYSDVTKADGTITAFKLPAGEYSFKETIAPDKYQLNTETYEFSIDEFGAIHGDRSMSDRPTEVKLKKTDKTTRVPIPGCEITIYAGSEPSEDKAVKTIVTDENGAAAVQYLSHGEYCFKETKAPEGYEKNNEVFSFTIDDQGRFICDKDTIEDIKIHGEIEIGKADAENEELMLEGAEFQVMKEDGTVVATVTTGTDGTAITEPIPYGNYTVKETKAPEGYNINATVYPVSITYSGKYNVDVRDSAIKSTVKVIKLNASTHTPVAGAEFEIIDETGTVLETITTDADGIANTSLLRYGNYTLRESKAPANYIAGDDVPFSVEVDGSVIELVYYETPVVKTGSAETNRAPTIIFSVIGLILLTGTCTAAYYVTRKKTRYAITKNSI